MQLHSLLMKHVSPGKLPKNLGRDYKLSEMLGLAQNYIKTVVMLSLCKLREPKGYKWLSAAMQDKKYKSNIVTLNHDLLLDIFFEKENIDYCDGFKLFQKTKLKYLILDAF